MNESNEYGTTETIEATPEQRTMAELSELVERGDLAKALAKAETMQAEQQAAQVAESKSRTLEMIEQWNPSEPLDGIIGVLEIGAECAEDDNKYQGLFELAGAIPPALPAPLLGANGRGGAVLTVGNVCVLSGQGGVAKSTLTASIALSFAACTEMEHGGMVPLQGGIFRGTGGRVMIASFEDSKGTISDRLEKLAAIWQERARDNRFEAARQQKVLCAKMPDPLFVGEGFELPKPTPAWGCLWETAKEFRPKLIVIDPIIGAYIGNGNDPPKVFAFVKALAHEAEQIGAGVLLVGHSNKAARQSANYDPYDAGHIAGTSAWTDAARGAMMMTRDKQDDNRSKTVLAISKANFGPSYIKTHIKPFFQDGSRRPCGMGIDGTGWTDGNDDPQSGNPNNDEPEELDTSGFAV